MIYKFVSLLRRKKNHEKDKLKELKELESLIDPTLIALKELQELLQSIDPKSIKEGRCNGMDQY